MRIKYIIPFAFTEQGVANRAAQITQAALGPNTYVECAPVKNHPRGTSTYYDASLFDMYITEAGLRAEDEGYDAVVMDTVTDSGLYNLRSRLSIPVFGPGLVSYAVGMILGQRFSIIIYSEAERYVHAKNLDLYHLWPRCASIRAANIRPDWENLFTGDVEHEFRLLTSAAERATAEDGADVILLGSTTMYQAAQYMTQHILAPVINPGPIAMKLTEAFVQLGLSHSKVAFPSPTTFEDDAKWLSLISAHDEGTRA